MVKEKITNETPKQRFERLATVRTNKAIEKIRVLGNCSNTNVYEYTQEDIDKIFTAIQKEIKRIRVKFENSVSTEFKLR